MIALDTNVLLRYLVGEDPAQFEIARAFMEGGLSEQEPGFISLVVVCELAWAQGYVYGFSRREIASAIEALADVRQLDLESPEVIKRAVRTPVADLADVIIHEIGKAKGCLGTVTFDHKFARLVGVELLD